MKLSTSSAYLAVVLAALACAAMQPEEASAVEREASRLGAVLWASDTVPAQRPATPLRDGAARCPACEVSP